MQAADDFHGLLGADGGPVAQSVLDDMEWLDGLVDMDPASCSALPGAGPLPCPPPSSAPLSLPVSVALPAPVSRAPAPAAPAPPQTDLLHVLQVRVCRHPCRAPGPCSPAPLQRAAVSDALSLLSHTPHAAPLTRFVCLLCVASCV